MKQRTIHLAATGARIATGAIVAIACAAGVVAATAAPWPEVHTEAAATKVTPMPGDTVLVCNGSFRALGRDSSQADLMVSAAAPRLRVESAKGATKTAELKMPALTGGVGAQAITGVVQNRTAPLVAASETFSFDDSDLRGLAAAPCREAGMHSWIVGGDMSTGAADVIVLSNPGSVPATVDLHVYGTQRSTTTTVVPAGTQVGLSLASVAGKEARPVIEVVASGAPVRAALQSSLTRTLDPVGVDLQDGASGPQQELELLGVVTTPVVDGDDATGVVLRALSPGSDTTATVRVRNAGGGAVIDEYSVDLLAGVPAEIGLSGLAAGAYDVQVSAAEPVIAAARQTARAGAQEDFAWMLPAPQVVGATTFSVPDGAPATLYLRSTAEESVTVTLKGSGGGKITIPADGAKVVKLKAGGYVLTATEPVHAAVGMRGGDGSAAIAGWPLWAPPSTQQPITVRP